jgi:hypothetical protein
VSTRITARWLYADGTVTVTDVPDPEPASGGVLRLLVNFPAHDDTTGTEVPVMGMALQFDRDRPVELASGETLELSIRMRGLPGGCPRPQAGLPWRCH